MTGKLIKYEIRSSIKLLCALWAALIVSTLFLGIEGKAANGEFFTSGSSIIEIFSIILPIVYGITFAGMIIGVMILIVARFYKGLLGEEGYLMHTLPVKTWQLITSKGVAALCIVVSSIIVIVISLFILFTLAGYDILGEIEEIKRYISIEEGWVALGLEGILFMIVAILVEIYEVYAAMSIGQLSGRRRVLSSIGAYLAIEVVINSLAIAGLNLFDFSIDISEGQEIELAIKGMWILIGGCVIELAAFHVITERILSKRLNLL